MTINIPPVQDLQPSPNKWQFLRPVWIEQRSLLEEEILLSSVQCEKTRFNSVPIAVGGSRQINNCMDYVLSNE